MITVGLTCYCLAAATFLVENRVQARQGQLDEIYAALAGEIQQTEPLLRVDP